MVKSTIRHKGCHQHRSSVKDFKSELFLGFMFITNTLVAYTIVNGVIGLLNR